MPTIEEIDYEYLLTKIREIIDDSIAQNPKTYEGMKAENEVRSNQGLSPAYGEKAFQEEAQELVNLGGHIRNGITKLFEVV